MALESRIPRFAFLCLCACAAAITSVHAADAPPPAAAPAKAPAPATAPVPAPKTYPGSRPLGTERWIDRTYGVSLLPPQGVVTDNQIGNSDGYVMRMTDDQDQFRMAMAIKRSNSRLTLDTVVTTAKEQIVGVQGTTQLLDEHTLMVGDHPGHALYFQLPQAKGINQFFAQGIVQIDAQTYALLEARCDVPQTNAVRATFDSVLASMQITDLKELDKQREATLAAGAEWRNGRKPGEHLTLQKLHAALIPQQYFRLVTKTGEAGYMRMSQSLATRSSKYIQLPLDGRRELDGRKKGTLVETDAPKKGVLVEIESRIVVGPTYFDTLAEYFLADDDTLELWIVTTTQRPAGAPGNALTKRLERDRPTAKDAPRDPNIRTSRETGIRTDNELFITIENPDGPTSHHVYQIPRAVEKADEKQPTRPVAYLSQVESLMLPQLLPIDRPGSYGFYCYLTRRNSITLRTDTVTPALSGVSIETRVSPNEPSLRMTLDSQRRLVEKQLSAGVRQVPTTVEELNRLWPGR